MKGKYDEYHTILASHPIPLRSRILKKLKVVLLEYGVVVKYIAIT